MADNVCLNVSSLAARISFIINNKIRNRTQENKIGLPGLSIALIGPQCIGLLSKRRGRDARFALMYLC